MPIDPSSLPPAASPEETAYRPELPAYVAPAPAAPRGTGPTPHLGHTLLFFLIVVVTGFAVGVGVALALMHLGSHLHESQQQMQTDPLLVIPVEAAVYAIAAAISFLVFPLFWRRSFGQGVHWRGIVAGQRWWALVAIGVATSVIVQFLSNFLPIPKELPIDKFFTHRLGVWLIAIFGVTVAPAFEELAFRGFLLPSLATAWDWVVDRARVAPPPPPLPAAEWQPEAVYTAPPAEPMLSDPKWSLPALIFSIIITSIGFAMLHGAQLAHSFAPLCVLFAVSVVLCITRLRFHSLAASTMVHAMYNATIFVMLFIGTDGFRHLDKLGK
jgi:membrane protease YdiL (CAAX protease family)